MIERGEFLESAEVHGNLYGTSQAWIDEQPQPGTRYRAGDRLAGGAAGARLIPDAIGVFILPPSLETLRRRLTDRGQDSDEVIETPAASGARARSPMWRSSTMLLSNQTFEEAVDDLVSIVRAQRLRSPRSRPATAT